LLDKVKSSGDREMKNQLFVGNLPFSANEDDLRDFFSSCGEVTEVRMPTDKITGRMRGFGFVSFATEQEAQNALSLNGKDLKGRELRINLAEERAEGGDRRSGGAGGGSRGGNGGGFGGGSGGGFERKSRWEGNGG
jgi:cold-inducible RNA-binding protein